MIVESFARDLRRLRMAALIVVLLVLAVPAAAPAAPQEQPAPPHGVEVDPDAVAEGHTSPDEHHESPLATVIRVANFAILAWILWFFLKSPIGGYLTSRSQNIRRDLVTAREMREAAAAQMAEIDRKLKSLPGELEALKARGAEDVRAERGRIGAAAAAERARLLEQTRREIEMRLRIAKRELTEHAAVLAVAVARERIARTITVDDQNRLLDRYTSQLREAR